MSKQPKGLFVFHRDFRIKDNTGLLKASARCEKLYTCFIFNPDQVGKQNDFKSNNAVQFMIESLDELQKDISTKNGELLFFYGNPTVVLGHLIKSLGINGIYFNEDYTPYALEREDGIFELCNHAKIECQSYPDYYLYTPKEEEKAYKKFTPFYKHILHKAVDVPSTKTISNFAKSSGSHELQISLTEAYKRFTNPNQDILVHGGRSLGIQRLKLATREQKKYDEKRDFFIEKTTFLSAYIKFGCVSIREVYHIFKHTFGINHGLIRELLWREFFAHVLYAYPDVLGKSYQPRYRNIHWSRSNTAFTKWKNGQTGFPIVDASMRQLNKTGYMHNRGRMTVASFLVKTLLLDWRLGEKYFAIKLTDYDIASNNGNWQGISGTGVDMKPYFRDMNPWIQQATYDADCEFIKKWVPELGDVLPKDIHNWATIHSDSKYKNIEYPKPMVDYHEQKEKMLKMYKESG